MKSIMETSLKRFVHLLLLAALSILTVNAKVISYPAPKGETLSSDYMVEVDGVSAFIWRKHSIMIKNIRLHILISQEQ